MLIQAALAVRQHAASPYSPFNVGAALLTAKDRIATEFNVESARYGLTCCAERVALFKALPDDATNLVAIAAAAVGSLPCGAYRQLLAGYAPGLKSGWQIPKNEIRPAVQSKRAAAAAVPDGAGAKNWLRMAPQSVRSICTFESCS